MWASIDIALGCVSRSVWTGKLTLPICNQLPRQTQPSHPGSWLTQFLSSQASLQTGKGKGKGKGKYTWYSASSWNTTSEALRYGSYSVTCKLHRTCLYLVSIHQMAHPKLRLRTSNCSLLLIYLPRKVHLRSHFHRKVMPCGAFQIITQFSLDILWQSWATSTSMFAVLNFTVNTSLKHSFGCAPYCWNIDCAVPKGSKRHFLPFSTFQELWHNSQ